jgi:hypothetical protein
MTWKPEDIVVSDEEIEKFWDDFAAELAADAPNQRTAEIRAMQKLIAAPDAGKDGGPQGTAGDVDAQRSAKRVVWFH